MRSSVSRLCLPLAALAVLVAALTIYSMRRANARFAGEMLTRTYQADNGLTYKATSSVTATYGKHKMKSEAKIVRAPNKLSITYISGDQAGLQSGYNERWFWRRDKPGAPIKAYAEVKLKPADMAAKRFDLMMRNYRAFLIGKDQVNGRPTEIVEVRPRNYVDGARGPFKRFWIDHDSGLTLRTDAFNYQKQLVMSTVLSAVELNPNIEPDTFASTASMLQVASRGGWTAEEMGEDTADVERETGIRISNPGYLPPGFAFDGVGVHTCTGFGESERAALSRYSDGVNALTIFALAGTKATKAQIKDATRGSCDFGPGTMVMADKGELHTVAVGDLPPVTLRRVLDSTTVARISSTQ